VSEPWVRIVTALVTAVATSLAGYFSVALPEQSRANANRDANWSARDDLRECNNKYISHLEEEH
jgi:hypothetical protein